MEVLEALGGESPCTRSQEMNLETTEALNMFTGATESQKGPWREGCILPLRV